ncbi:hypothetical protein GCM10023339_57710 [Alloalcanivorax gelatiniphagus]
MEFLLENPLFSKKRYDFYIYKLIIELMENREHLTLEGLRKIVALKSILNTGTLSEELKAAFFPTGAYLDTLRTKLALSFLTEKIPKVADPY